MKIYCSLWVVIGLTAYIYRTVFGNVFIRREAFKVEAAGVTTGGTVGINLIPIDRHISFQPGQFVFVRFLWGGKAGVLKEDHPFSIASAPYEPNFRLFVKPLGDFTDSLKKLKPGMIAEVEGAFGRFVPSRHGTSPQVWVAGGIGITPFLSAARSFSSNHPPVDLFYSVLNRQELLDQDALSKQIPKYYKHFKYHPFVTGEQKRYLTAAYIAKEVNGLAGKEIFLCGPPPMMKSLRSQFKAMGVGSSKIHSEEFALS